MTTTTENAFLFAVITINTVGSALAAKGVILHCFGAFCFCCENELELNREISLVLNMSAT